MESRDDLAAWALLDIWRAQKTSIRISLTPLSMRPDSESDVSFRLFELPGSLADPSPDAPAHSVGFAVGEEIVLVVNLSVATVVWVLADPDEERFLRMRLEDGTDCLFREIRSAIGVH